MLLLEWNGVLDEPAPVWEFVEDSPPPAVKEEPKRRMAVFKGAARDFFHYEVLRGGWIGQGVDMEIDTGGTFAVRNSITSPPLDILPEDEPRKSIANPRRRFLR